MFSYGRRTIIRIGAALCCLAAAAAGPGSGRRGHQIAPDGVWQYLEIRPSQGPRHSANGLMIFDHGRFVQQVLHEQPGAEPTMALGNEGSYTFAPDGEMRLNVDHSVILDIAKGKSQVNRDTRPIATLTELPGRLMLRFGGGTVHVLQRLPLSKVEIRKLPDGAIGFAGPHFVLVSGADAAKLLAYGRFSERQGVYTLDGARWSEDDGNGQRVLRDQARVARFLGPALKFDAK